MLEIYILSIIWFFIKTAFWIWLIRTIINKIRIMSGKEPLMSSGEKRKKLRSVMLEDAQRCIAENYEGIRFQDKELNVLVNRFLRSYKPELPKQEQWNNLVFAYLCEREGVAQK